MALLDRLRPQPGWKHADPAIRLAAVESLPATEQALFAQLAREDEAPRVRRAAVARLDDPDALGAVARGDADEQVKADAIARLTKMAVESEETAPAVRAVAALADERHLASVARSAAAVEVCEAALERLSEAKALGGTARHAEHETVRLRALARLNDRGEIEAVATHTEHKDVGLAALERLEDTTVIDGIAVRAKNKVVARRARAIVKERAAADAETRAAAEALAKRRAQLTDALEALEKARDRERALSELERLTGEWLALGAATDEFETRWQRGTERVRMHIDDLARQETADAERRAAIGDAVSQRRALIGAAQAADGDDLSDRLAALRAEWAMLHPFDADELKGLDREFNQACTASEARAAARVRVAAIQERLAALAADAAQVAEIEDLQVARGRWTTLAQEWREQTAGLPVDAALHAQFNAAATRWQERDQAHREAAARSAAENQARLQELADRATALSALPETPIKEIDRAVRELRGALDSPGPLPSGGDELIAKLKATLGALTPRLREAREADDWRRWANAGIQEELCKRMDALREMPDVVEVSRQLRDLRRQWKAVAAAPKDDADVLWQRFKTTGDEVQARVDTHLAAVLAEQAAQVTRKLELVEKAEALAQSTDWIATADTLKGLQAEWQTIGPAPKDGGKELRDHAEAARRFRSACDTFFTRRKSDLAQRKGEWAQNQQKKEALCARMEQLAESTEWTATFNEIKKLQAEWKAVGPVRRNKSEALWKRFRGACDRFFERYGRRHEIDLRHRVEEREAICRTLEALAPGALEAAASAVASATAADGAAAQDTVVQDTVVQDAVVEDSGAQAGAAATANSAGETGETDAAAGVAPESQDVVLSGAAPDDGAPAVAADIVSAEPTASSGEIAQADAAAAPAPPAPVQPPAADLLVKTVQDAWRRWIHAPGLPSEAMVPVRARFESALATLLTSYAAAFHGTPFDLEQTRKRMRTLCEDVENATKGMPAAQLGATSVAALASLLKESLAANTIGGRVNEEAKLRATADRIRRAQMAWRDIGPALDAECHQLEARFHRACRRFFEQHPQFDQPHGRDHGHHQGRDRDARGPRDRDRGPRGPRPQGGGGGAGGSGGPGGRSEPRRQ